MQAGPLMVRAYLNVRATGGAVFPSLRGGRQGEVEPLLAKRGQGRSK